MGSSAPRPQPSTEQLERALMASDKDVIRLIQKLKTRLSKCIALGLCVGAIIYLFWFLQPKESPQMRQFMKTECIVCQQHNCEVILLPCLHFIMCEQCASNMDQCPVCRINIERAMNIVDFLENANQLFED